MSIKGFFIALACIGGGVWGIIVAGTNIVEGNPSLFQITIFALSFLAMFFGVGVLSTKIKL